MSQVSLDIPDLGEVNATADPKIRSAFIALAAVINGGLDSSNVADASLQLGDLATAIQQMLVPTGATVAYAGATAPAGWLLCDGSAVSRTTFSALFSAIGTTFGVGDGATTFNVPDLRGRVPVGAGLGTGLTTRALGAKGGEETHVLTTSEIPDTVYTTVGVSGPQLQGGLDATLHFGSGGGHNNMQPFQATNFLIKT